MGTRTILPCRIPLNPAAPGDNPGGHSNLRFRPWITMICAYMRKDGRVVEGAALEKRYTLTGIVGSNPTLSAS